MRRIAIGDIMTRNFASVLPTDSVYSCAKLMAKRRVNSVLLAKEGHLYGILTARDILWLITKKPKLDLRKISATQIATKKIAVISPSADISQALRKMTESNFRRLPVLARGELIGVVTLKDILAIEPSLYSETRNLMDDIREEERKIKDASSNWQLQGICENCGVFSELLKVNGQLLCNDCRESEEIF